VPAQHSDMSYAKHVREPAEGCCTGGHIDEGLQVSGRIFLSGSGPVGIRTRAFDSIRGLAAGIFGGQGAAAREDGVK